MSHSMSSAAPPARQLHFENVLLAVFQRDNQLWVSAADLARALGYSDAKSIAVLYQRHADEFTEKMTQVIPAPRRLDFGPQSPDLGYQNDNPNREKRGNPNPPIRIFTLRGAYLVAMLSRTPVGKAFRRWILDLLDFLEGRTPFGGRIIHTFFGVHGREKWMHFLAGHADGRMERLSAERKRLVLAVCEMKAKKGMTRGRIADALGISPSAVSGIIRRWYHGAMRLPYCRKIIAEYAVQPAIPDMEELTHE